MRNPSDLIPSGVFLGLTTVDLQYLVDPFPVPNSKNKARGFEMAVGGPAVNAAASFVALGGHVQVMTVVGDHSLKDWIAADFAQYGLDYLDLSPGHTALPTLASVWTSRGNGDRTIVTNQRSTSVLQLNRILPGMLDNCQVVLVDGFHMEAAIHLAQMGRARGIPVVMDGGSWKEGTEELVKWIDIAICSADFGVPAEEPVLSWFNRKGVSQVAVTQGGSPILYTSMQEEGELPVEPVHAVDTLGAGDVFHGAFCYYYTIGNSFRESLSLAAKIAGRSCQYMGAKTWISDWK